MKKITALILATTLSLSLIGCGQTEITDTYTQSDDTIVEDIVKEPTYTLNIYASSEYTSNTVDALYNIANIVSLETDGDLVFNIIPSYTSIDSALELSIQNTNTAVLTTPSRLTDYAQNIEILQMPYIASSIDEFKEITKTSVINDINSELSDNGLTVLSHDFYEGYDAFFLRNYVDDIETLKNIRIGADSDPFTQEIFEYLEINVGEVSWTEVENSINNDYIAGIYSNSVTAYKNLIEDYCGFIIKTDHNISTNSLLINSNFLETIPASYKEILLNAVDTTIETSTEYFIGLNREIENLLVDSGMRVNQLNTQSIKEKLEPMYADKGLSDVRLAIYSELNK